MGQATGIQIIKSVGFCILVSLAVTPAVSVAQTHIYVTNNTSAELVVRDIDVGGDPISKKAWKKGDTLVSEGETRKVLAINRTGKFNWMDPTPRFVEPGKTTLFTVLLESSLVTSQEQTLGLKLKLLGTGKSSKMWYSLSGATTDFGWELEIGQFDTQWRASNDLIYDVSFKAYEDKGKTHVEYTVSALP